jgi:hypothetical protein
MIMSIETALSELQGVTFNTFSTEYISAISDIKSSKEIYGDEDFKSIFGDIIDQELGTTPIADFIKKLGPSFFDDKTYNSNLNLLRVAAKKRLPEETIEATQPTKSDVTPPTSQEPQAATSLDLESRMIGKDNDEKDQILRESAQESALEYLEKVKTTIPEKTSAGIFIGNFTDALRNANNFFFQNILAEYAPGGDDGFHKNLDEFLRSSQEETTPQNEVVSQEVANQTAERAAREPRLSSKPTALKGKSDPREAAKKEITVNLKDFGYDDNHFVDFEQINNLLNQALNAISAGEAINLPDPKSLLKEENIRSFVYSIAGSLSALRNSRSNNPSDSLLSLRKIMYGFKKADIDTYDKLAKLYRDPLYTMDNAQGRLPEFADKITPFRDFLKKILVEYTNTGPSAKFKAISQAGTNYEVLIVFSNINNKIKDLLLSSNGKAGLPKGRKISDEEEMRRKILESVSNTFFKKFNDFLSLENKELDLTKYIIINLDVLVKQFQDKAKQDYTLKPCPVCFKWIPSSFGRETTLKEQTGFRVLQYSPVTADGTRVLTEDDLNNNGQKWNMADGGDKLLASIKNEEEKKFFMSLIESDKRTGGKPWSEIKQLLSGSTEAAREGWHRRAHALAKLGGSWVSTSDVEIKDKSFSCPMSNVGYDKLRGEDTNIEGTDERSIFYQKQKELIRQRNALGAEGSVLAPDASFCGATVVPKRSKYLSDRVAFQLGWNGMNYSPDQGQVANVGFIDTRGWENISDVEVAKTQLRGGFKFSNISFGCPCHISDVDYSAVKLHSNVVISKAGPAGSSGFVYPTTKDGTEDKSIPNGTMSFMVCGAQTSLSSFDRDDSSPHFILNYLVSTKERSPADYGKFLNTLTHYGMDPQDIMALASDVDRFQKDLSGPLNIGEPPKQASSTVDRINKIKELFKTAAVQLSVPGKLNTSQQEIINLLSGLHLVCPFGHRFSIGHSLKFGPAYAAIFSDENNFRKHKNLSIARGQDSSDLITSKYNLLIPLDQFLNSYIDFSPEDFVYYEKWLELPIEKRDVFPKPNAETITKTLKISINGIDYVFNSKKARSSNPDFKFLESIWSNNSTYTSPKDDRVNLPYEKTVVTSLTGAEGEPIDVEDVNSALAQDEDDDYLKISGDGDQVVNLMTGEETPFIKNEDYKKKEILAKKLDQKISAMRSLIVKALETIGLYSKGVITDAFLNNLLFNLSENPEQKISQEASKLKPIIQKAIESAGIAVEDMVLNQIISSIANKTEKIYEYIEANILDLKEIDFDIDLTLRVLSQSIEEAGLDVDTIIDNIKNDPSYTNFIEVITKQKWKSDLSLKKTQEVYSTRIVYVATAIRLAEVLSSLYNRFFDKNNPVEYVGYDLGLDLKDKESVLWNINSANVSRIKSSFNMLSAEEKSVILRLPETGNNYGYRMDLFYKILSARISNLDLFASSPSYLIAAKEFFINRLKQSGIEVSKTLEDSLESSNVINTIKLSSIPQVVSKKSGSASVVRSRVAYVSKKPAESKFLSSLKVTSQWIVKKNTGGIVSEFSSEAEANSDRDARNASEPGAYSVARSTYYQNEKYRYDSSKLQVGVFKPKLGTMEWVGDPDQVAKHLFTETEETGKLSFVGFNLPIQNKNQDNPTAVSKSKTIPTLNHKIIINFDGEDLDISFLFARGRSKEEVSTILNLESEIRLAYQKIKDKTKLDDLSDLITKINDYNLALSSSQSYYDYNSVDKKSYSMLGMQLVDPWTAFKLINNPYMRGLSLSVQEQKKYKDFIIRVFNLKPLIDKAIEAGDKIIVRKKITLVDTHGGPDSFTEKLFDGELLGLSNSGDKDVKSVFAAINSAMKKPEWLNDAGEYFDIKEGSEENPAEEASFVQFIFNSSRDEALDISTIFSEARSHEISPLAVYRKSTARKITQSVRESISMKEFKEEDYSKESWVIIDEGEFIGDKYETEESANAELEELLEEGEVSEDAKVIKVNNSTEKLLIKTIDSATYSSIEELSKLVGDKLIEEQRAEEGINLRLNFETFSRFIRKVLRSSIVEIQAKPRAPKEYDFSPMFKKKLGLENILEGTEEYESIKSKIINLLYPAPEAPAPKLKPSSKLRSSTLDNNLEDPHSLSNEIKERSKKIHRIMNGGGKKPRQPHRDFSGLKNMGIDFVFDDGTK